MSSKTYARGGGGRAIHTVKNTKSSGRNPRTLCNQVLLCRVIPPQRGKATDALIEQQEMFRTQSPRLLQPCWLVPCDSPPTGKHTTDSRIEKQEIVWTKSKNTLHTSWCVPCDSVNKANIRQIPSTQNRGLSGLNPTTRCKHLSVFHVMPPTKDKYHKLHHRKNGG